MSLASELKNLKAHASVAHLRSALKCHEAIKPGDYGCRAETPFDLCPACEALACTDPIPWLRQLMLKAAQLAHGAGESGTEGADVELLGYVEEVLLAEIGAGKE